MSDLQPNDPLYRRWDAGPSPAAARAAFLLVHGLGAHHDRWDFWGRYFSARGYASYAVALRGFGRTPDRPRGHVDSWRLWDRDILALRRAIDLELPGTKVFLAGESMGGLVAYDLAARGLGDFAGMILMAPAFRNGLRFPPGAYAKLALTPVFPRRMIRLPFTSEMATRDPEYAAVMNSSPDELREASARLMAGFLPAQARAGRLARRHRRAALFLIPGVDHLVDERGARRIFAKLAAADKTLIEYPDMFHALTIDLGRERVFADVLDWTSKRV